LSEAVGTSKLRSALLRASCAQILADEVTHVRFQRERPAILFQRRCRFAFRLIMLRLRLGFLAVMVFVWVGHRRALWAGGTAGSGTGVPPGIGWTRPGGS
jgi:hypothetical protein